MTIPTTPPVWAKHAIWYQIFPERFHNGDPANDPKRAAQAGAAPFDISSPWAIHPWGADWYKRQPWEQDSSHDIWHHMLRRRYGGDLQGILDKLDYLQDLGINALYLNPVFHSPSHHKYDGLTYHHVDPDFGPAPEADRKLIASENAADPKEWVWTHADRLLLELVAEVHHRGMRIILDGVFNHMSLSSWPFQDVHKRQQNSAFADWFKVRSWRNEKSGSEFVYDCWWAVPELPELNQDANGLTAGPKKYVFDITERWMAPDGDVSRGIDGWRLDVAFEIALPFWRDWREHVKKINPDAYLTAEIIDSIEKVSPFLQGDTFDAIMNYNFAFAAFDFFLPGAGQTSASAFSSELANIRAANGWEIALAQQNLFDSHDTDRVASHIENASLLEIRNWHDYHNKSKARNRRYVSRKPSQQSRQIQKLMVLFKMTYAGAPMIYYGDEAGMWGANDPCCRKPMLWPDIEFEAEEYLPSGKTGPKQEVRFDQDMHAWYKNLIALRNRHAALREGDLATNMPGINPDLFVFERTLTAERLVIAINRGSRQLTLPLNMLGMTAPVDLVSGKRLASGQPVLTLPACSGFILQDAH